MIELLPTAAFVAGLVATGFAALSVRDRRWAQRTQRLAIVSAVLAATTFLVLLWKFLVVDVRTAYVFLYTHADLPLRYRIAGTWAGREGSLALWALWSIAIAAWFAGRWTKNGSQRWSLVALLGLATAFLGAVAASDLFAPTSAFFLQQRPLGNGLNPTLQSDFFLIHPPMMFLAYALTNVPAAAALGHFITGRHKWSQISEGAARFDWFLYTIAMGLGGIWAYYTLGFGGFWAWDPVEVANLLPWLGLTIYLHAQRHHLAHGRYTAIGPFLALLPFLLTLFSTISTRSGLWVSVHAFTDPTQTFNPDAVGRFLDILDVEAALAFPVGLLLATMLAGLALWGRRLAIEHDRFHRTSRIAAGALGGFVLYAALDPISAYTAIAHLGHIVGLGRAGIGMLALLGLAILIPGLPAFTGDEQQGKGLVRLNQTAILVMGASLLVLWLWHMAATNGWNTQFYEARLPYLAAPAALALMVFMGLPWGRAWIVRILVASTVVAVAAGVLWEPGIGLMVLSLCLLLAAADRTRRAATAPAQRPLQWGRWLLLLGALLDVAFWLNPPTTLLGGWLPEWVSRWPAQLIGGGLALWMFHRAMRHVAGAPGHERTAVGVALLGGFYVAPVLAFAARRLLRGAEPRFRPARLPQAGLYLVHFAVALALVGYSGATYLAAHEQGGLEGEAQLAGVDLVHVGNDGMVAILETPHGLLEVPMEWQPTVGAYYPLPATLRTWTHDLYINADRFCIEPCTDPRDDVVAFQPTRERTGEIVAMDLNVHVLPAIGLVWTALALFGYGMILLARPAQSGIDLSTPDSR